MPNNNMYTGISGIGNTTVCRIWSIVNLPTGLHYLQSALIVSNKVKYKTI